MTRRHHLPAADIASLAGEARPHPVNPKVNRVIKSLGDLTGLTALGVHIFETEPGADTTAFHLHHHEDEAIYVLSGTAEARVGDQVFAVGPGDFLGCPKGGPPHMLRNTGPDLLRCLVVGQRLDEDVIDYPDDGRRLRRGPDGRESWEKL